MNTVNEIKNPFLPAVLRLQAFFPRFQGKERGWGHNVNQNNPIHLFHNYDYLVLEPKLQPFSDKMMMLIRKNIGEHL